MNFKGHIILGFIFSALIFYYGLIPFNLINLITIILGCLVPDIDIHSHIRKFLIIISFLGILILALMNLINPIIIICGLMLALLLFTKHRGFIHSIFFGALVGFIIEQFLPFTGISFFIGFLIHRLGDWV